jgi:hypothetical protein
MKPIKAIPVLAAVVACAAGYFLWVSTRVSTVAIYLSGPDECFVSRVESSVGSTMECREVPEFLRRKMGVRRGAKVLVGSWREVPPAEVDNLVAALVHEGYRIDNVFKVAGFVNDEPANR